MNAKLLTPANVAAAAFSVALGLLSFSQWRASTEFSSDAVAAEATITELRTAKQGILEGSAETFATVSFPNPGAADVEQRYTAELPTPIHKLNLDPDSAVGSTVPILYDPQNPKSARYGRQSSSEGALILAILAVGALFVPTILRRSSLAKMGGGGGG